MPPHNPDAERGVLGGLLRDPDSIPAVQEVLAPAHFYFDAHQKIYAAVCELVAAAKPVDLVLLYNQLQLAGHLADAGGHLYLAQLWEAVPTGANVEYHARLVREAATVRALIHASNETLRDAYDRVGAADELVGAAERRVMEVARAGLVGEVGLMAAAVDDAFARLDARAAGGGLAVSGVPSGFSDLDHLTAGFQDGDLVVVAARPSVGKTAFGLNLARHAVVDESLAVLFFSLEMGKAELAERLLAAQARVDSHRIRKGAVDSAEIARLMDAGDALRRTRFYIDDTPNRSMTQIAATARRVHRKEADRGGLKLVIVDYLQLVEPESRRDPRHEQVGQISRRLKHLARELRVPVIAMAQVNRASEDRQDSRPRLSDLRESGSIEQDADTVVILHRPGKGEPDAENVLEVIVAKHRNGPVGDVVLAYEKQFVRFGNYLPPAGSFAGRLGY